MNLNERLEHFEENQLEQGDTYGAEVLHNARVCITRLEAKLAAHLENEGDECPLCVLEAENERLREPVQRLVDRLVQTGDDTTDDALDDLRVALLPGDRGEGRTLEKISICKAFVFGLGGKEAVDKLDALLEGGE
jgi:hypothetical protein